MSFYFIMKLLIEVWKIHKLFYELSKVKKELFEIECRAVVLDSYISFICVETTDLVIEFFQGFIPKDNNGNFIKVEASVAVRLLSIGNGQGYLKCNCSG